MTVRSFIKKALLLAIGLAIIFAVYYVKQALPILSGYGAKNLCSCVFVGKREVDDVIANELGRFPLSLGKFTIDLTDSSAYGSVLGLSTRKAIYRNGLGCSLISQIDEAELRLQKVVLAKKPQVNQDTVPWPYGNLLNDPLPNSIDQHVLQNVIDSAFMEPGSEPSRRTRAIVIVHKGQIIAEQYAEGFDQNSRQMGWSMTKSLTNAMVGNLVLKERLKIDKHASVFEWIQDERRTIKLNDLMHMSSGLAWNENYAGPSNATNMLFKSRHMGLFAATSKLRYPPGTVFYYSSGTTNIISRLIRQTFADESYYRFPYEDIFYKIGMLSLVMEPDAGGSFVGSSYAYATARDWARFGLLYLNDGVWKGERILPEGWVDYSTTRAQAAPRGEYGAQFWLNAGPPDDPSKRIYPDAPTDLYWADGFEGQNVFIIPSQQLVIVKLSQTTGNALDDNWFLKRVIDLLPE